MLQINKNFVFASSKMYALWDSTDAMIWNGILVNLGLLREPLGAPLGLLARCFGACWTSCNVLVCSWATLGALLVGSTALGPLLGLSWRAPGPSWGPPLGPQGRPGGPEGSPRGPEGVSKGSQRLPKVFPRGHQGVPQVQKCMR